MLEQAQEARRGAGRHHRLPRAHRRRSCPIPTTRFGLVTCRVAAHHFSSPEQFIREAARVLKMYGYLVVIDTTVPDDHVEAHAVDGHARAPARSQPRPLRHAELVAQMVRATAA